jgi:hypothetical protein
MCLDPATAMMIGSTLISAKGAIDQGNYASKVAENNALSAKYAADDALARGAVEEQKTRDQTRALMGRQRAALAANGINTGSGTGSLLLQDAASAGEFDALTVRNNAMKQAYGFNVQADNLLAEGKATKAASRGQAMGTLLTGGSKAYSLYKAAK